MKSFYQYCYQIANRLGRPGTLNQIVASSAEDEGLKSKASTNSPPNALALYVRTVPSAYWDPHGPNGPRWVGYSYLVVSIEGPCLPFFQSAYDSLKASVYQSVYLQTAGKALLDQVELVIDDKGLRLGFDALNATLQTQAIADPANAAVDLAEFIHFAGDSLAGSAWDGAARLSDLMEATSLTAQQVASLSYLGFKVLGDANATAIINTNGTGAADGYIGRRGNDNIGGNTGNDILIGGVKEARLTCRRSKFGSLGTTKTAAIYACSMRARGQYDQVIRS